MMINTLNEIKYRSDNIGYFPMLYQYCNHGFSWGRRAGNMQYGIEKGHDKDIKERIQQFFDKLNMGKIYNSINMISEHKDRIQIIDETKYLSLKPNPYGRTIECDAIFSNLKEITLTVKPGDCTTAIISAKLPNNRNIIGLVHSGRRGVSLKLPQKAIELLINDFKIEPKDIHLGIVPHLFQMNRRFENINDLDLKIWNKYIIEKDGFYFPAETEFAIDQYLEAGVLQENLSVYNVDTYKAAANNESFSYKYHFDMTRKGERVQNGRFLVAISSFPNDQK